MRADTELNLAACRELGWEGHVAHAHTVLGLAALPGDPAAARTHLEAARLWAAATGEVEVALRCLELAARLALAERGFVAAEPPARATGATSRRPAGFGLFAIRFANLEGQPAARRRCSRRAQLPEAVAAAEAALAAARARLGVRLGPGRRDPRPPAPRRPRPGRAGAGRRAPFGEAAELRGQLRPPRGCAGRSRRWRASAATGDRRGRSRAFARTAGERPRGSPRKSGRHRARMVAEPGPGDLEFPGGSRVGNGGSQESLRHTGEQLERRWRNWQTRWIQVPVG